MSSSLARGKADRSGASLKERARRISRLLIKEYPDARCMLNHSGPFELLVATILAAQCTDERVNSVTPELFGRFSDARSLSGAEVEEIERLIRSTGFFRAKARSIKAASSVLQREFSSSFPERMEDLLKLPGVGRKTANVILGTCFGQPAIIVDTHVRRVAQRLGLVSGSDPDEIEKEICALLPKASWTKFSHAVTFHGRKCCSARKPAHDRCPVRGLCPSRSI